jgi:glutamate/tyrosine decarboxylase-like PLP-dependent enzyme
MYTYEVAPVFTLIELDLIDRFCKMVGFTDGEGTFAPGGAHANLLGMAAARQHHSPQTRTEGLHKDQQLVCFTSKHSHYTIPRGAVVLGIGSNNAIYVDVDSEGRMIPEVLDRKITEAIAAGKKPFLVNATCGTTVYGAYDDLNAIGEVCEKHKVWFHVDACWGGHCLFSPKHKDLMKGSHRANSISLTGTKCFGLPQQCALIVLREKGVLRTCNSMNADYLFHEYEEKNYDLGDLTLNCGRRVDSFKLWVSLKVHGEKGFEERTEHAFDQARYVADRCRASNGTFELAHNPQSLNVCFWYVPKVWRNKPRTPERDAVLDKITGLIRRQIQLDGKVLTNFADVHGQPHFFRHITCNPGANGEDMDVVLGQIERFGDQISESQQ